MTNRTHAGILFLVLAAGLAGCNSSPSSLPSAPSPVPQPPPPNGELISGSVHDSALRTLAGASVEVLDGPQAGTSTTTDAAGQFSLRGTFDDTTQFRATKEGHVAATRTLLPYCAQCNPHRWIYFYLAVLAPPVNMAGDYRLTFIRD